MENPDISLDVTTQKNEYNKGKSGKEDGESLEVLERKDHQKIAWTLTGVIGIFIFLIFPSSLDKALSMVDNIFLKYLVGLIFHTLSLSVIVTVFVTFFKSIDLNENHPLRKYRISYISVEESQKHYNKLLKNPSEFLKLYVTALAIMYTLSFWFCYLTDNLDLEYSFVRNILLVNASIFMSDFWYYLLHRISHHRLLYSWLHKPHHEYYNVTIMSNFHASVPEYFIFDIPTSILGWLSMIPFIGKVTPQIITLSYMVLLLDQLVAHSGYDLPFWIDKVVSGLSESRLHYFHHKLNQGSFGALFGVFDRFFNTYNLYYEKNKKE